MRRVIVITLGLLALAIAPAEAQRQRGSVDRVEPPKGAGVAWFPTLAAAQAEARRSQRAILLLSARPSCRDVPGLW